MKCIVVGYNDYTNNVTHVCYHRLPPGDPEQCKLWLLAIGNPDVNTLWDVLQQHDLVLHVCSNYFLDSDCCGRKESITQENCCSLCLPRSH